MGIFANTGVNSVPSSGGGGGGGSNPTVYHGYVDFAATPTHLLPAGWSAIKNATGSIDITHNLGLSDKKSLIIVCMAESTIHHTFSADLGNSTANTLRIFAWDVIADAASDADFWFIAINREE